MSSEGEGIPADGRPLVLAIDDSDEALEIISYHLTQAGYTVIQAKSGHEGLALARSLRPNVIALDILMPDLDGWEVFHRLRSHPDTERIPVVVISITDRDVSVDAPDVMYVPKPISRDQLLDAVAKALQMAAEQSILIVGDNSADRDIFSAILSHHGYRVFAVSGELEAIKWLQEHPVGLILVDLAEPDLSGYEVLDFARDHDKLGDTPIIVVTTRSPESEEVRQLESRGTIVLQKQGLGKETLISVIDKVLSR